MRENHDHHGPHHHPHPQGRWEEQRDSHNSDHDEARAALDQAIDEAKYICGPQLTKICPDAFPAEVRGWLGLGIQQPVFPRDSVSMMASSSSQLSSSSSKLSVESMPDSAYSSPSVVKPEAGFSGGASNGNDPPDMVFDIMTIDARVETEEVNNDGPRKLHLFDHIHNDNVSGGSVGGRGSIHAMKKAMGDSSDSDSSDDSDSDSDLDDVPSSSVSPNDVSSDFLMPAITILNPNEIQALDMPIMKGEPCPGRDDSVDSADSSDSADGEDKIEYENGFEIVSSASLPLLSALDAISFSVVGGNWNSVEGNVDTNTAFERGLIGNMIMDAPLQRHSSASPEFAWISSAPRGEFRGYNGNHPEPYPMPMPMPRGPARHGCPMKDPAVQCMLREAESTDAMCQAAIVNVKDAAQALADMDNGGGDFGPSYGPPGPPPPACFHVALFILFIIAMVFHIKKRRAVMKKAHKFWTAIHGNPQLRAAVEAEAGESLPTPPTRVPGETAAVCLGVFARIVGVTFVALVFASALFMIAGGDDMGGMSSSNSSSMSDSDDGDDMMGGLMFLVVLGLAGAALVTLVSAIFRSSRSTSSSHTPTAPSAPSAVAGTVLAWGYPAQTGVSGYQPVQQTPTSTYVPPSVPSATVPAGTVSVV